MKSLVLYFLILGLGIGWFLAIAVPSWIFHVEGKPSFLCCAIEYGFSSICHQIPERSFWIWGHPLAVCARCTGIYAGFLLAILLFPFLKRSVFRMSSSTILILAFLPSVCEFSSAHGGILVSNNFIRFLVGIPLGIGLGWLFLTGVFENKTKRKRQCQ